MSNQWKGIAIAGMWIGFGFAMAISATLNPLMVAGPTIASIVVALSPY